MELNGAEGSAVKKHRRRRTLRLRRTMPQTDVAPASSFTHRHIFTLLPHIEWLYSPNRRGHQHATGAELRKLNPQNKRNGRKRISGTRQTACESEDEALRGFGSGSAQCCAESGRVDKVLQLSGLHWHLLQNQRVHSGRCLPHPQGQRWRHVPLLCQVHRV